MANLPGQIQSVVANAQSLAELARNPTGAVQRVVVRTKYLPDIVADMPLAAGQPGAPSKPDLLVRIMQPKVTLVLHPPLPPVEIIPAGDPGESQWPVVKWTGIAAVGVLGFIFLRGLV